MRRDNILRHLFRSRTEVFLALARTRSFTATARRLRMSQSSVSRAVAELERDLGVALIEHDVRPLRLTPKGAYLRKLLSDEYERLSAGLSGFSSLQPSSGPLRVGIVESVARVLGHELTKTFAGSCSAVTILTGIAQYLLRLLDENEIDVMICSDPFAARGDLERRFLLREPSIVLMPSEPSAALGSAFADESALSWETLQNLALPMIRYHRNNSGGRLEEKLFNDLGLSFESELEVDVNELLLTFVREGRGWTITRPTSLVQHPELLEGVRVLPMPEPVVSRELFVMTRKAEVPALFERVVASAARAAADALVPQFAKYASWVNDYVFYLDPDDPKIERRMAAGSGLASRVFIL